MDRQQQEQMVPLMQKSDFIGNTVEPFGTDTSVLRTPLYYGQFPMSRQNSHIFSFEKKPL